jgi:hypothetical protein
MIGSRARETSDEDETTVENERIFSKFAKTANMKNLVIQNKGSQMIPTLVVVDTNLISSALIPKASSEGLAVLAAIRRY